jgi:hypothetical protein
MAISLIPLGFDNILVESELHLAAVKAMVLSITSAVRGFISLIRNPNLL